MKCCRNRNAVSPVFREATTPGAAGEGQARAFARGLAGRLRRGRGRDDLGMIKEGETYIQVVEEPAEDNK